MEIVAMDMKLRGMYIARQLSFTGVTFKIEEVPLTQHYIKMYNKSVRLVRDPADHALRGGSILLSTPRQIILP